MEVLHERREKNIDRLFEVLKQKLENKLNQSNRSFKNSQDLSRIKILEKIAKLEVSVQDRINASISISQTKLKEDLESNFNLLEKLLKSKEELKEITRIKIFENHKEIKTEIENLKTNQTKEFTSLKSDINSIKRDADSQRQNIDRRISELGEDIIDVSEKTQNNIELIKQETDSSLNRIQENFKNEQSKSEKQVESKLNEMEFEFKQFTLKTENSLKEELQMSLKTYSKQNETEFEKIREEIEKERQKQIESFNQIQNIYENHKKMLLRKMEEMLESGKCFAKSLILEESSMRIQQDKNLMQLIQGNYHN